MKDAAADLGKTLVLFTNTYPYGVGETFLHDELPYVAARFKEVVIYPLYVPQDNSGRKELPGNVTVRDALLPFDHKDRVRLACRGLFNLAPLSFAFRELFSSRVLGSCRNIWIFFNYLLLLRAVLGNRRAMASLKDDLRDEGTVSYFYWGDKSALIIPFMKKYIRCSVVRFHGSDIYEEAKGYLPFRSLLYPSIDYAVPVSRNGADYIRERYSSCLPGHICLHRLGSVNPYDSPSAVKEDGVFRIASCSNVIELKRLHLIAGALSALASRKGELAAAGFSQIRWTHFGDGPLMEQLKAQCAQLPDFVHVEFKGRVAHDAVLAAYNSEPADLFLQVSRSEGVPVSLMEALSFGMPVMATDVGGVAEIVDDSVGKLLSADLTAASLADDILQFICMPSARRIALSDSAVKLWRKDWNAAGNYSSFAEFVSAL